MDHLASAVLPTLGCVPDDPWGLHAIGADHLLGAQEHGPRTHRAPLNAIILPVRSGCQWNRVPREFPDDSSVHRTFSAYSDV
jgi:transposase